MFVFTVGAKIKSSRLADEMSFSRGHTIKVKVPVIGRPFPKVTWIKDGEILEENEKVSALWTICIKDECIMYNFQPHFSHCKLTSEI